MLKAKLIALLLSIQALLSPCSKDNRLQDYRRVKVGRLPRALTEISGLCRAEGGGFWAIRDSGGPATLYKLSPEGALLDSIETGLRNVDWEALATDDNQFLYIGDFGNNQQTRQNLSIYRVHNEGVDTLKFSYPKDSVGFSVSYDCEAMVWFKGQLHLFTKGWASREVRHYLLPSEPGVYTARLLEKTVLPGLVTDAAINAAADSLILLSYGKAYLFNAPDTGQLFFGSYQCLPLNWVGQSEAAAWSPEGDFYLSNETRKFWKVLLDD